MSQIIKGIFGALAVTLTFGAVQFASGHDLVGGKPQSAPETGVNRTAKADRVAVVPSRNPDPDHRAAAR